MQRAESLAMCYVGDAMTVPTTGAPELGKPGPEAGYPQLRSGWWASGGPGLCDGNTLFTELISPWLFKERDHSWNALSDRSPHNVPSETMKQHFIHENDSLACGIYMKLCLNYT